MDRWMDGWMDAATAESTFQRGADLPRVSGRSDMIRLTCALLGRALGAAGS
jgi:hypothetical protein